MSVDVVTPTRILVVDDDIVDLAAARRALLGAYPGCTLVDARDAESALAEIAARPPDCVLLDLQLPGRTGLEMLEELRAAGNEVPVIVLTGQGDESTAVELMKAGASDYIPKSQLSRDQLTKSVRHALRMRAAEASEREARVRLERYAEQLRALADTAHAMNAILSVEAVVQMTAERARQLVGARVAIVRVLGGDGCSEVRRASLDASCGNVLLAPGRAGTLAEVLPHVPKSQKVRASELRGEEASFAHAVGLESPDDEWLVTLLCARGGRPMGVLHVAGKEGGSFDDTDDIVLTQLSQMAAVAIENARLFETATQAARARDDMVAVVSHDLRNPLSTIVMACRLLLDRLAPETKRDENLRRIDRAAHRMQALVSDLLDLTRIESGQLLVSKESTAVAALVDDAVDLVAGAATEKLVTIEKNVGSDHPPLQVDRERILQVLGNLLGNAVKFTPRGGRVTVSVHESSDGLVFAVKDVGPGIAREHLPHVFDRYWQASSTTRVGTGLGLFIAKGIIDAHGGRIWVESEPGHGSCFCFTLTTSQANVA